MTETQWAGYGRSETMLSEAQGRKETLAEEQEERRCNPTYVIFFRQHSMNEHQDWSGD